MKHSNIHQLIFMVLVDLGDKLSVNCSVFHSDTLEFKMKLML